MSIQIIVDNALEPYLGVNKRMPIYLDGEMSVSFQLERGQLDTRVLEQTFGYISMDPSVYLDKMPSFQISFLVSAGGLDVDQDQYDRMSTGEIILSFCKIKRFTIAGVSGKSVIANRWEGYAEGISFVSRDVNSLPSTNQSLDNSSESFGTVNKLFDSWYNGMERNSFQWEF